MTVIGFFLTLGSGIILFVQGILLTVFLKGLSGSFHFISFLQIAVGAILIYLAYVSMPFTVIFS